MSGGAAHCAICLDHCPLDADSFAIFPCGHGFCTGCLSQLFNQPRPRCPTCRCLLHRRDAHPVYLEFVDSQTLLETSVVQGLKQMDANTPHISVKKASQKLTKILEGTRRGSEDNMSILFRAIEDFKERIAPIFSKVETQKEEIASLSDDLRRTRRERDHSQNKLRKLEVLQTEITKLKAGISESDRNTEEALRLAEQAKDELGAQRVATTQWKARAAELEQDNRRYKDLLERNVNAARLQKEKYRKLSKEIHMLKSQKLAQEERELTSAATSNEYDGDFSGHEHSKIHSDKTVRISATPSRVPRRYSTQNDENTAADLDVEGIPPANFPSEWQLEGNNVLKKRNVNGDLVSGHRRVANSFPIHLDRKGHPTRAVQLGPKSR